MQASVWKPSEVSPLSAIVLMEAMAAAGLPKGVVNLLQGDGPTVGAAMSRHPGVDMVSFTGSTRGGIAVAHAAADTVKRVHQELGGKSANIILPDADFETAVAAGNETGLPQHRTVLPGTDADACPARAHGRGRRHRLPRGPKHARRRPARARHGAWPAGQRAALGQGGRA